jgi:hypothetical protein
MNGTRRVDPWIKRLWLSTWPLWALLAFASLAAVRWLSRDFAAASLAASILLMIPGSLTLGAVFNPRRRPRGLVFICYAALLSAVLSVFSSLALYACGVLITAQSTYWCLLAVLTVLATTAEVRLLLARPPKGRRASHKLDALNPNQSDAETDDVETPATTRHAGYYSIVAVLGGVSLLAGGLYAYDRLPHPAPPGYTWMAWTGPATKGDITIGSTGTELSFQIVHQQPDNTTFELSAWWLGIPSRPLTKSLTLSVGPNQTYQGTLFVPQLPNGCTYRIVVALTAAQQIDPLTKKPKTWSINVDVHDPSKSSKACK